MIAYYDVQNDSIFIVLNRGISVFGGNHVLTENGVILLIDYETFNLRVKDGMFVELGEV